jgi:hypothetical protein
MRSRRDGAKMTAQFLGSRNERWAVGILAAYCSVGPCGKFLDDYHIKAPTKTKMRKVLVEWFVGA